MTCSTCEDFSQPRPIRLPADLTSAILLLQAAVAQGRLTVLPAYSATYTLPAFSTLDAEGPWHEIVENRFACTACGQKYLLSAETYHGHGGSLEVMTAP
ncbi:hypothetical protein GAO09_15575 [Rhizobiales bacterium RZME27]|uniref:Uncharacterized protein n=1 Tax=Endobacterium cereale TaxID=2663029 RepID=A0A6A8A9T9_9HYPH|nr:hypothetical protein [Endobacterium cereale]MEB2847131.1 hypothetical protein [Endobacterium cereale]MQY47454.1 hypothetical protein [Endobacterium cereale]